MSEEHVRCPGCGIAFLPSMHKFSDVTGPRYKELEEQAIEFRRYTNKAIAELGERVERLEEKQAARRTEMNADEYRSRIQQFLDSLVEGCQSLDDDVDDLAIMLTTLKTADQELYDLLDAQEDARIARGGGLCDRGGEARP